jgi:hypothetical protein
VNGIVTWAKIALWAMLAVAAAWVVYRVTANYGNCRVDGTGKLGCLAVTLFMSTIEFFTFVVVTMIKLLLTILP